MLTLDYAPSLYKTNVRSTYGILIFQYILNYVLPFEKIIIKKTTIKNRLGLFDENDLKKKCFRIDI